MVYQEDPNPNTYAGSQQAFRDKVQSLLSLHQVKLEQVSKGYEKLEENCEQENKELREQVEKLKEAIATIEKRLYVITVLGAIALVLFQAFPAYVEIMHKPSGTHQTK